MRYDPASKGFLLDETTAPYARRMFEVFNTSGGSASQMVRQLNRELREGHPSSLAPPTARRWNVSRVLNQTRSPLYRRRTQYSGN